MAEEGGAQQDGNAPQESRIGIYLRLRPSPRASPRVTADTDARWVDFSVPKEAAAGLINNSKESYRFPFNGVLPPDAQQDAVWQAVGAPVLAAALDGYSGTVFAYGQTGSGKTFTMTGGTERYADRGLIPRALAALYKAVAAREGSVSYTVHLSYLEIYNEVGYDLLDPGREVRALEDLPRVSVQEDEEGGLHVRNLSLHRTANEEEALNLLFLGDTNRTVAETPLNQASSRSHCMFSLHIEARRPGEEVVRRSRLNFVDLAGSERVGKTGLEAAVQVREAKHINLSLHFLEQVIVCLQERKSFVPYRNSLLTLLLRDSLGGNCRTVMVATVTPEAPHIDESISTCRFAQRVAQIKNRVTRNEELDLPALVRRLRAENLLLRQELELARGGEGGAGAGLLPDAGGGEGAAGPASSEQQQQQLDLRRQLSEGERRRLASQLRAYLEDPSPDAVLGLQASMRLISAAFGMMKALLLGGGGGSSNSGSGSPARKQLALLDRMACNSSAAAQDGKGQAAADVDDSEGEEEAAAAEVRELRRALHDKQRELDVLVGVLHKQGLLPAAAGGGDGSPAGASPACGKAGMPVLAAAPQPPQQRLLSAAAAATAAAAAAPPPLTAEMLRDQNKAFEYFCASSPAHDAVQENKALLRSRLEGARALGERVAASKQHVARLRSRLEARRLQRSMAALLGGSGGGDSAEQQDDAEEAAIRREVEAEKTSYRDAVSGLRDAKQEVEQLQAVLEHSRARLQRDFQAWWRVVSVAVAGAVDGSSSGGGGGEQAEDWRIAAVPAGAAVPAAPAVAAPLCEQPGQMQQSQSSSSSLVQPSFAGWAGAAAADTSLRYGPGPGPAAAAPPPAAVVQRPQSSSGSGSSSRGSRNRASSPRQASGAAGGSSSRQQRDPAAAPVAPAAAAAAAADQAPDPLAGVDPEVLEAARPLLTGDPTADADIVRFYLARAALLRGAAGR